MYKLLFALLYLSLICACETASDGTVIDENGKVENLGKIDKGVKKMLLSGRQKNPVEIPPIDAEVPQKLATATFALG